MHSNQYYLVEQFVGQKSVGIRGYNGLGYARAYATRWCGKRSEKNRYSGAKVFQADLETLVLTLVEERGTVDTQP